MIAEQLGLDAPDRVKSLALLCTPEWGGQGAWPGLRVIWIGLRNRVGALEARRRAFLELILPKSALMSTDLDEFAQQMAPYFGRDLAENPPILMQQVGAMRRHDVRSRLPSLGSIATLVVSADEDPIAPPTAGRATTERIGSARHVELPDSSHGVTIHRADMVNRLLASHWLAAE